MDQSINWQRTKKYQIKIDFCLTLLKCTKREEITK